MLYASRLDPNYFRMNSNIPYTYSSSTLLNPSSYANHDCQQNQLRNNLPFSPREFVPVVPCYQCARRSFYASLPSYLRIKSSRYNSQCLCPSSRKKPRSQRRANKLNTNAERREALNDDRCRPFGNESNVSTARIPRIDELEPLSNRACVSGLQLSRPVPSIGKLPQLRADFTLQPYGFEYGPPPPFRVLGCPRDTGATSSRTPPSSINSNSIGTNASSSSSSSVHGSRCESYTSVVSPSFSNARIQRDIALALSSLDSQSFNLPPKRHKSTHSPFVSSECAITPRLSHDPIVYSVPGQSKNPPVPNERCSL